MSEPLVNVRYMVDDVESAIDFYTTHFGFAVRTSAAPAFERTATELETRIGFLIEAINATTQEVTDRA